MSKKRILIVDDEIDLRIFLTALFKIGGHTPVAARDGREGLRKATEQPPDLVVLDVMMPGEGGILMYRKLKTDPRLRKIPVLILSAVNPQSFKHFLKMHNTHAQTPLPEPEAYVEKPPQATELLAMAERLISPQAVGPLI